MDRQGLMLKVVFQSDSFLVIDKPFGLVTTSSQTNKELTLEDILKSDLGINIERGGIVHRLDKDTSGLLVVAKTAEVLEKLQAQFKERSVQKEYLTLAHGFIKTAGKISVPIGRNPGDREKFAADPDIPGAREAVTEYEPIELLVIGSGLMEKMFEDYSKIQLKKLRTMNYEQYTFLKCHPLTGRTHQIRVHLKYLEHPVVGDAKYGGRKTARLDRRWCTRQFLHAAKLELNDPDTGKRLKFESRLPEDLQKALSVLEKIG